MAQVAAAKPPAAFMSIRVALIARSTLFALPGGDTVQVQQTALGLRRLGLQVDVFRACDVIPYAAYDLLHFFNLFRPADILRHVQRSGKPFVISPVWVDYSEYDRYHRAGISGWLFRSLPAHTIEYCKTTARILSGRDSLVSPSFFWKGQLPSIRYLLSKAAAVLPNSASELARLHTQFTSLPPAYIVPNGIDPDVFAQTAAVPERDPALVLCIGRIEGIKNQLNLIRAVKGTPFRLELVGAASKSQAAYYRQCRKEAGDNVLFLGAVPQNRLPEIYSKAAVHVLPSWFETTGLSSLEAAALGCSIVVSDRGDVRSYFETDVHYCDPADPASILSAIEKAAAHPGHPGLREKIFEEFTWQQAALASFSAYRSVLQL
jgi:glycosyltransferase involved in cell wall biosynthesis